MKNQITQFSIVIIAFVALTFLMSYTRPAAEELKQYVIVSVSAGPTPAKSKENLEKAVSDKLAEGWRPMGGVSWLAGSPAQAMVK